MKEGDVVEYVGKSNIRGSLKGCKFTVSEIRNYIGVVKLKELISWYDMNDFKVMNKAKNK